MSLLIGATSALQGASGQSTADLGEPIEQSLRFAADSVLHRDFSTTATSNTTGTFSFWVKKAKPTGEQTILMRDGNHWFAAFIGTSELAARQSGAGFSTFGSAKYRDPSAWYHFVVSINSNTATTFVNGTQISTTVTTDDIFTGGTNSVRIGSESTTAASSNLDGYLAEFIFVDGQALDEEDFGRYNDDGVWVPIEYTGTFGTNGYHLDFADSSNLGNDVSGNNNDFTAVGFNTTALSASNEDNDIDYLDTPTSNYGVLNPLQGTSDAPIEANLSTQSLSSVTTADHYPVMEVSQNFLIEMFDQTPTAGVGNPGVVRLINQSTGDVHTVSPGLTSPDQIGIAVDIENRATYAYDITNGAWLNGSTGVTNANVNSGSTQAQVTWTTSDLPTADRYLIRVTGNQGAVNTSANRYNFGQRAYLMDEPSGFVAVQTNNLPEPTIKNGKDHFGILTYTGDGATTSGQTVTDTDAVPFTPDLVWIKKRGDNGGATAVREHILIDSVRGKDGSYYWNLSSNEPLAQTSSDHVSAIGEGSITVHDITSGTVNQNLNTFVAWCWKAGGAPDADNVATSGAMTADSVSLDGALQSSYTPSGSPTKYPTRMSINTTAGFSIVMYEGTGSNLTLPHGLGVKPDWIVVKNMDRGSTNWNSWHVGLPTANPTNDVIYLNLTDAQNGGNSNVFRQDPDTNVFSLGTAGDVNTLNETYIAYIWAGVEGFSKFGSYIGNGTGSSPDADGPFVYLGFRPAFVMAKRADSSVGGEWSIYDSTRETTNPNTTLLLADANNNETSSDGIDLLSNGFKVRGGSGSFVNQAGDYIYMAFAENPFGGENAPPATAR